MTKTEGSASSAARDAVRSRRNRIRYRFDRMLSRGMWAVLLWLGAITLVVVIVSAALVTISGVTFAGSKSSSLLEDFWQSLLRVIDPGTMADDVGWGQRILALFVTMTGLLIAGTLIGLIAAGVEQRVEGLRRGRSIVVETGHYVVLGWSPRLRVLIDQLSKAEPTAVVVVLAARDTSEMDDELRPDLDPSFGHRLIFRSGDPRLPSSLELANVDEARAVIVPAPEHRGESNVVTTVLTLGQAIGFDRIPIVAEIADERTRDKLLRVAGPNLHPVIEAESASRSAALVLRQPGLSEVVEELLDAATPGVHVKAVPTLVGSTFGKAVLRFDTARPIGLIGVDGGLRLNPPPATTIEPGDQIAAIAAGPAAIAPGARRSVPNRGEPMALTIEPEQMSVLFVGWNWLAPPVLAEFDLLAAPGSTALVLCDDAVLMPDDVDVPETVNIEVACRSGTDPTDVLREAQYTAIVLLGGTDAMGPDASDERTLLDLALVKRELAMTTSTAPQLLVQLHDADRAPLAGMAGLNGFLISDGAGSQLMAQLATSPQRQAVFARLYDPASASLHLVSPERFGVATPTDFADVVSSAYAAGVLAIGRLTPPELGRRAILSPAMSSIVERSDQIIVIG